MRVCTYIGLATAFGSWGYAVISPQPNVYFGSFLYLAALICLLIPLWESKSKGPALKIMVSVVVVTAFVGR